MFLESGNDYNYDRDMTLLKRDNVFEIIEALKEETQAMQSAYPQTILGERARTDDDYLIEYLSQILKDESNNEVITAFNMKRTWLDKNLAQDQIDALTLFLFEESYKEYELILVYAYMQARTQNPLHFNVFQDLIDESHFHLKSFLLFLFGLQIEIVQSFIDGRFFSLLDVVADSIGIVIGVVFVWLFKKAIR